MLLNPDGQDLVIPPISNFICENYLDADFGITELKFALSLLKMNKAPGVDAIPSEFYKNLSNDNIYNILIIFNRMYNSCIIPDTFREAIIFPILKKGDLSSVSNYRGISFLSCFYKLFSQLLLVRIRIWSDKNKILNESQAGFRKNYSTADNLFTLTSIIEQKISKPKRKVFAFLIDFSAAFDTINRKALLYKLHCFGFSTKMVNIIEEIYKLTTAKVWTKSGFTKSFESS